MSKDRRKLLHIHSSVNDKQPTPATLELGELGVNNAKGNAFISTKNSDGEIVRFSEDETIIGWMEKKEVFPYEGYMRGANSGSSGVTESDLLNNKSNIIIKLNQVVPENTDYSPYDEKVNGAKDIYGNPINPISPDENKDGAGLAIDMSNYAMIGANPSFSSVTTTCGALLQGTTEIEGLDGGCGSEFNVHVDNSCIETDKINIFGSDWTKLGISCDDTTISDESWLKGKKVWINAPQGDGTVAIDSSNSISANTLHISGFAENDIVLSAETIDTTACTHNYNNTNDFQVKECTNGGSAGISSTTINNSASTIDEKACTRISELTDEFKVTECTEGSGTTTIKSCKGISAITDDFVIEQCSSGTTHIHSCSGITLESRNITLTDGDCGSGQTTIEVNDLCLVGERKVNVYGDETNVGLDCDCTNGQGTIATNTRVFGKGTLITTSNDCSDYAASGNVETKASQDINENASRDINETATGDINENATNITNTASNDICDQADNEATFYGEVKTNVGINCDDTATAATTSVKGGKVIVDASTSNLGLTAKEDILESAENDIIITANNDICETAGNDLTFYGVERTRVGIDCGCSNVSTETTVNGGDISVFANDNLCESGKTVTVFAGEGGKLTIGGNSCSGNTGGTYPITYVRRPKNGTCDIHATTVDDALDEVYNRSRISLTSTAHTDSSTGSNYSYSSYTLHQDNGTCDAAINFTINDTIVSMSASTNPSGATGETLITYYLWQYIGGEKKDIGVINIPKDHLIEDVRIVYGTVENDPTSGGQTFITCSTQSQDCHWYIEMKWHVWDGSHTDKLTYIQADTLVQDISSNNNDPNRGVKVDVWYNSVSGRNEVSADTKLNFATPSDVNDFAYTRENGEHYESGTTIVFNSGTFSPNKYKPWSASTSINVPTHVAHLERGTLKLIHNGFEDTYDPASASTFTLPHSALTIQYGVTCGIDSSGVTYDTSNGKNITVPKTISDVTNSAITYDCTGNCITVSKDICMSANTIAAKGFYSKSDINLKENIQSIMHLDYKKTDNFEFKSFNFKDDETKQKTYGVIAQEVQGAGLSEIVHVDENGTLSVDYTSLLILKIANLEYKIKELSNEIETLKKQ